MLHIITGVFLPHQVTHHNSNVLLGLFNTFTFYKLGNSQINMQSRLFSSKLRRARRCFRTLTRIVFLTLTIAPPLIQQLQPKYLEIRGLFQSRESNSKIYSWVAFVTSAILVEIPYSLIAGTLVSSFTPRVQEIADENHSIGAVGTGASASHAIPTQALLFGCSSNCLNCFMSA